MQWRDMLANMTILNKKLKQQGFIQALHDLFQYTIKVINCLI